MKKLSKVLLPAIIVLMGASAAFVTVAAKSSNDATETGYYINSSGMCVSSDAQCSTNLGNTCEWRDPSSGTYHDLFRSGTACSVQLAKIP